MRKTKIVATAGPACGSEEKLKAILHAGADVIRINASHTSLKELRHWILLVRRAATGIGKPVGILVDLQGPRVRTGSLKDGRPVELVKDREIFIRIGDEPGNSDFITTPTRPFARMLKKGDPILIDNGALRLEVLQITPSAVKCRVLLGGMLGENKGINLPHAPATLPALTEKDRADLMVASQLGVDFIALSFVRSEQDVMVLQYWLSGRGRDIGVIAKVEKPGAVKRIGPILRVSQGVMVARGDLGIEMGVEKIPVIQKELINHANDAGVPVITATQMLESMMTNPYPSRAEASDIANAVFDGTDAVMLSGETAVGKYPVEAVRMMAKIVEEAEKHLGEIQAVRYLEKSTHARDLAIHAITHAARHAAKDLQAKAILVFTRTGRTAALISKFRPVAPVFALVSSEEVARRLSICRGVFPVKIRYGKTTDAMIREADRAVSQLHMLKPGDPIVVMSGRQALPAARYMTKIHYIGER